MPAPGPVLIHYIMSKLLLAAAPIETLIKAIKGSSWGGAWGEEAVSCVYTGVAGWVSVHGCLKGGEGGGGRRGRRSFVVMGRGDHLLSPATLPPSASLSTPSSGCSTRAEPDWGWFIALQQREADGGDQLLHISAETVGGEVVVWGRWGEQEHCGVADQLINLGPINNNQERKTSTAPVKPAPEHQTSRRAFNWKYKQTSANRGTLKPDCWRGIKEIRQDLEDKQISK